MVEKNDSTSAIIDLIRSEPCLASSISDIIPMAHDPSRLFRVRWTSRNAWCVLKTGVGELEPSWMQALASRCDDVVPTIYATGSRLGRIAQDWIVMQELTVRGRSESSSDARHIMRVAARFQQEAVSIDLPTYPIDEEFLLRYGQAALDNNCPGPVSEVMRRIVADNRWLRTLSDHGKVHGDCHYWNAVAASPDGPWKLIDPIPRNAHWAWDAAYAQMTSGIAETPDLVSILAEERRRLGMASSDGAKLDMIRSILLGWTSMMWWTLLPHRRKDPWWTNKVQSHVHSLANLPKNHAILPISG